MKIQSAFVFFVLIVVTTCTVKIHLPDSEEASKQQVSHCADFLKQQYPQSFLLTQRIVLTAGGKQYDFIGTLKMNADTSFHMVAVGEMGGTFLEMKYSAGKIELIKNPGKTPKNPLIEGVVGDINYLYRHNPGAIPVRSGKQKTKLFLQYESIDTGSRLFCFEEGVLHRSEQVMNRNLIRKVEYRKFKKFEGIMQEIPTRIILKNEKWRYSLKIDLLKINVFDI